MVDERQVRHVELVLNHARVVGIPPVVNLAVASSPHNTSFSPRRVTPTGLSPTWLESMTTYHWLPITTSSSCKRMFDHPPDV
jgi:hypothetical protein